VNALHEQFITEARELISQATDDLIALDREGSTPERIDRVFRAFHTLKGSAGIVELPAMSMMLHAAEDVLAAIHAGRIGADSDVIDQGLACLDQVSKWVDEFEARAALPAHAAEVARAMAERLRAFLPEIAMQAQAPLRGPTAAVAGALPEWASILIDSERAQILCGLRGRAAALSAISYEPHAGCFFNGDDPIGLMRQVPDLLAFRIEPREAWGGLADLDPFACNLRLCGISAGDRAELAGIFRLVADQVRIIAVSPEALRPEQTVVDGGSDAINLIRSVLTEQQEVIRASSRTEDFVGRVGAAARAAANALRHGRRTDLADDIDRARAAALSQNDATLLLSALEKVLDTLRDVPAAGPGDGPVPGPDGAQAGEAAARPALRLLRVDEARIDALVNLAGELIVAKNGLVHLARKVQDDLGDHDLAGALRREHEAIERIAGDMHAAILQLRMVPAAQVLRPFTRLVRDMSQRLHKKVELVVRGEAAEADKTIVDRLFEPLLHLVRNALDHGIEAPAQRLAAGKADVATIAIQASRVGDRFVVEVIDDGRGIDPAMIRRNARERKLMTDDELAALSDEQAVDLIFSAGFSTAAEVSDISGRGVGMDVVRTTVEQIGGRVSLTSAVGAGTTVRLDLPMNIALSRIMVVEAGGQLFGIPMDAVTETVRLTPDRISQIKNNDGFVLRDRVVPICSLAELMKLPGKLTAARDAKLLIVAEASGKIAALEVDAVRDRLDIVLKPMRGLLAGAKGYSGTTLLGDGRVLLVLDLKEILS
jgi:two-component system chemotaxis sensor kinase CheA